MHALQPVSIAQPKLLQERIAVAQAFSADYGLSALPLLVDDPATEAFEVRRYILYMV